MDSSNNSDVGIKIFSGIFLLFGCCGLLLCCGGCILSKKKYKQQNQIHFTNHRHSPEVHAHIFTIAIPDIQPPNTVITGPSSPYSVEKPPPSYESIEGQSPVVQHESNLQISSLSTTKHAEQTSY